MLGQQVLVEPAIEGQPVAWFSPTYKMLAEVWRETFRVLHPALSRVNAQEHRMELVSGGIVDMWSLDSPDVARGRKYKRIVVDEAAMVRHLETAWTEVVRPTLADMQGDAWFMSTPRGRNYFWTLWQRGADPTETDWASWQMPTSVNPYIAPTEIAEMRKMLPERAYRQEVLAEFVEDGGGVFRFVSEAATAEAQSVALPGHQYVIGADWARSGDFSVFAVVDVTDSACVALDRFTGVEYAQQRGRLRALADRFQPTAIIAESNAMGEPVIEMLRRDNLPVISFQTTNATKSLIVDALALAFEQSALRILADPVLIAELQSYESERLPSGLIRYGAPEGMHDDTVMALALAWHGVGGGSWAW